MPTQSSRAPYIAHLALLVSACAGRPSPPLVLDSTQALSIEGPQNALQCLWLDADTWSVHSAPLNERGGVDGNCVLAPVSLETDGAYWVSGEAFDVLLGAGDGDPVRHSIDTAEDPVEALTTEIRVFERDDDIDAETPLFWGWLQIETVSPRGVRVNIFRPDVVAQGLP